LYSSVAGHALAGLKKKLTGRECLRKDSGEAERIIFCALFLLRGRHRRRGKRRGEIFFLLQLAENVLSTRSEIVGAGGGPGKSVKPSAAVCLRTSP
jgi:hypothetical protein